MRRAPALRAVLGGVALALCAGALLAGCGQKGPLFLPSTDAASARPIERLPSAPDDMMPRGPVTVPAPATSSPGLPSGVAPGH